MARPAGTGTRRAKIARQGNRFSGAWCLRHRTLLHTAASVRFSGALASLRVALAVHGGIPVWISRMNVSDGKSGVNTQDVVDLAAGEIWGYFAG